MNGPDEKAKELERLLETLGSESDRALGVAGQRYFELVAKAANDMLEEHGAESTQWLTDWLDEQVTVCESTSY